MCSLRGVTAECDSLLNAFFLREKRELVCFDAAERGGVTNFASVFVATLNEMACGQKKGGEQIMYHLIFFYAIFSLGRSKNNAIA